MKAFAAGIVAAGLLLATADPADDVNKRDAEKLQGTWTVVSAQSGGKDAPADLIPFQGLSFDKDTYTPIVNGKPGMTGAFHLDAAQKPATIDLVGPEGKVVQPGIYLFDGDALKLALVGSGQDRPTTLVSTAGSHVVVLTLKRDKK